MGVDTEEDGTQENVAHSSQSALYVPVPKNNHLSTVAL